MTSGNIRRSQLISPFGVGAMTVLVDGTSVIAGGLDHWFEGENAEPGEFRIDEWRLQRRLRVSHFRLPPHYVAPRKSFASDTIRTKNLGIVVPFLRFPSWSFCPYCKRLNSHPLTLEGKAHCPDSSHKASKTSKGPIVAQVPFVTVCERGHLDDFPWREWVHYDVEPTCEGILRLRSRGGGSLAGQEVSCDTCGQRRTLENVMNTTRIEGAETTFLSSQLQRGADFACRGSRPWLGSSHEPCGQPIRASLRGASNVYFPLVESSIYLPQSPSSTPEELIDLIRSEQFAPAMALAKVRGTVTAQDFRAMDVNGLADSFSDRQIDDALAELIGRKDAQEDYDLDTQPPTQWRYPEYAILRNQLQHSDLVVTVPPRHYGDSVRAAFHRVRLVDLLRETRALWGFTRVTSSELKLRDGKQRLRLKQLSPSRDWLPAYTVNGEGIYLELDEARLLQWEERTDVRRRSARLIDSYEQARKRGWLTERDISPRFILIHTIAHLLINQLIFECGYSTASLRERLFVSSDPDRPMVGLLIYTAAGDAEGTMGGLVRMGKPGNLERVWDAALANAEWCSTDPICMETGEAGQGPDNCNMAACHSCALLPETSCEEFNRFLDRGLVVGSIRNPELGFFYNKWDG